MVNIIAVTSVPLIPVRIITWFLPVPLQLQRASTAHAHGQHGLDGQHGSSTAPGRPGLHSPPLHDEPRTASPRPHAAQKR